MRIHNPSITGSLSISGSGLSIDGVGTFSGSTTSTGSFGHLQMNGKDLPKLNETGSSIHIGNGAGAADDGSASRGNIFVGFEAGNDTTSGHSNVAIGDKAYDQGIASTDYNIAIGRDALGGSHAGAGADRTVAIGSGAAFGAINNVTGMVAVGYESLLAVTTGKRNTALGYQSGNSITDGEDNVIIGWDADGSGTGATNQIVIGRSVTGTGDNQTVIGNSSQTHVIFGGSALISGSAASTGSFGVLKVGPRATAGMAFQVSKGNNDFIKVNSTNALEPILQFGDIEALGNSGIFTIDGANSKYTFTEYNVGIGNSSPTSTLTVEGNISGSGTLTLGKYTAGSHVIIKTSADEKGISIQNTANASALRSLEMYIDANGKGCIRKTSASGLDNDLFIQPNHGDVHFPGSGDVIFANTLSGSFTSTGSFGDGRFTGKVGIGDTTPAAKLVVVGDVSIGSTSNGLYFGNTSGVGYIQGTDTEGSAYNALGFKTSGNYAIYIDTSDRVGIGTTTPFSPVQIKTSSDPTSLPIASQNHLGLGGVGTSNGIVSIGFGYAGATTSYRPAQITYKNTQNGGNQAGELGFWTRNTTNGGDRPLERLRIEDGGDILFHPTGSGLKVGIGTTTPGSTLTVVGDISGSGNFYLKNNQALWMGSAAGAPSHNALFTDTSDMLIMRTNNTLAVAIEDNNQAVGIGVVPETDWRSTNVQGLQVGAGGSIFARKDAGETKMFIAENVKWTSDGFEYINNGPVAYHQMDGGTHGFYVAPSGTADAVINATGSITIANSGNVGIGTTSPDALLEVGPDANSRGIIKVTSTAAAKGAFVTFYGNDAESAYIGYEGGSEIIGSGVQGDFVLRNVLSGKDIILGTNAGNVGINTVAPVNNLHIVGDNGDQLQLDNDGDQFTQINFAQNGTAHTFISTDHTNKTLLLGAQGSFSGFKGVRIRPDGSNDIMTISGSGSTPRVGIGTTSPATRLHIVDGAGTLPTLIGTDYFVIQNNDSTGDQARMAIIAGATGYSVIDFGDASDVDAGGIAYQHHASSDRLWFRVNATDAFVMEQTFFSGSAVTTGSFGKATIGTGNMLLPAYSPNLSIQGSQSSIQFRRGIGDAIIELSSDAQNFYLRDLNTSTNYLMKVSGSGNIDFPSATKISGSAATTGSFGAAMIQGRVTVGGHHDNLDANVGLNVKNNLGVFGFANIGRGGYGSANGLYMYGNPVLYREDANTMLFPLTTVKVTNLTATSTGSFADGKFADFLHVGKGNRNPSNPHLLSLSASAAGTDFFVATQHDGGQAFRMSMDSGGDAAFEIGSAGTSDVIALRADGTSHFNGGKVGIGTDSPSELLTLHHSAGDGDGGILIVNENTTIADNTFLGGIGWDSADGNIPSSVGEAGAAIVARSAEAHGTGDKGTNLLFLTAPIDQDDDTTTPERMRIDSEGKVGIGQDTPTHMLDIFAGTLNAPGGIHLTNDDTGGGSTDGTTLFVEQNSTDFFIRNYENAGIRMRTNDTDALYINSSQNVGIGTLAPTDRRGDATLQLNGMLVVSQSTSGGDHHLEGIEIHRANVAGQYGRINQQGGATHIVSYVEGGGTRGTLNLMGGNGFDTAPVSYLQLGQNAGGTGGIISGSSSSTGSFGRVNTITGFFEGGSKISDYVFEDDYNLRTLDEVETHISQSKHLPGIPSEANIQEWRDLSMGDKDRLLLEKIEELTLYTLQLNKRIEELERNSK